MTDATPSVPPELAGNGPEDDVHAMYIAHVACDIARYQAAGAVLVRKPDPSFEGLAAAKEELLARMRARGEL